MQQKALYNRYIEGDGCVSYLFAVLGILGVQLVVGIVAVAVQQVTGVDLLQNGMFNYTAMILMQAVNIAAVALVCGWKKTRPDYSVTRPVRPYVLPLGLVVGAVCLFGFYGLAYAFDMLLQVTGYAGTTNIPFTSPAEIAVGSIVTVLIAPLGEELVYRGALLSGLKKGFPTWAAVLLSGASFSLMHMNPQQTVYQFCLGCVCALFVVVTGTPVFSMIVHGASNLIAVLMEVTPFGTAFEGFIVGMSASGGTTAAWILVSAVLGAGALFGLAYACKRLALPQPEKEYLPDDPLRERGGMLGNKTGKVCLGLGMAVCLVLWIIVMVQGYVEISV